MVDKATLKYSFKKSIPVFAGYIVLGMGFGILLQSKGYPWWLAPIMSISIYAGSMQYVAVDLLATGASYITTAIMTIVVNFRHIFYGVSMLDKYKNVGAKKPYLIFALTDETFSLVCMDDQLDYVNKNQYYLLLSLFNQCYWIIGSTIGAIVGNAFKFNTAGVEFSMTALFVTIFIDQWEKSKNHFPAISGIVISVICLFIFGPSGFLIPSLLIITVVLLLLRKKLDGENAK